MSTNNVNDINFEQWPHELENRQIRNEIAFLFQVMWEDILVESWFNVSSTNELEISDVWDIDPSFWDIFNNFLEPEEMEEDIIQFESCEESTLLPEIIETLPASTAVDTNSSCPICLENYRMGDICITLPCAHSFHKVCLEEWFQFRINCPLCRKNLTL